ncbi:uncharacterized protein BKCO1_37000177 [Diplodia corticola]|uniref:ubiquitinyl hydrolase 1 n=1 Tax=Diplodia corticola TaxID=236234 RepID=A0A1J9RYN0_9PEZI|nr:uncharacterized protein BKCO1_37000177 [Diplodia corticola]OJD32549.1 hypothetical protein BKCO1_37000177 [Diplodia corticola]
MASSRDASGFLINHVIFPAKLPQHEEDLDTERSGEQLLIQLLNDTLENFLAECAPGLHVKWKPVCCALQHLANGCTDDEASLSSALRRLEPADATIIHVKAQNAGLLLFRPDAESVMAHAFEASAQSEHVMGSSDRLTWRFPGQTVIFRSHLLHDSAFVDELAAMVLQMSVESVESSMHTRKKASSAVTEERETANPRLVTEALMAILSAWGHSCQSPDIVKHVRDDVNWSHSRLPWRRSPLWLVARVSIQILLSHTCTAEEVRIQYKNFMAFFVARLCNNIITDPVDADVKMIAATKAARRLAKLRDDAFPFVGDAVRLAVANVHAKLDSSWSKFQTQESPSIPSLPTEATIDDCTLRLANSRDYLRSVALGHDEKPEPSNVPLESGPRLAFKEDGLPQLRRASDSTHNLFLLTDFEVWVMNDLHSWTSCRNGTETDCDSLLNVMRTYVEIAREEYKDNPRSLSVMLLAALEIWKALDTICLQLYPLMRKFGPAIPGIANPLLLPQIHQMKCLDRIENHLAKRWKEWDPSNPSILGQLSERSFCFQFYAQSQPHQAMRKKINDEASERRVRKRSEWMDRSEHHRVLLHEASRMEHTQDINKRGQPYCKNGCPKCSKEKKAHKMRINVDEWPLPADEVQARAAVFELDCPAGFSAWRDATWLIIQDLGRTTYSHGRPVLQPLQEYGPLIPHASNVRGRTITIASQAKSFLKSHYRDHAFPVTFEKIAVNNGLRYGLVDSSKLNCWVMDQMSPPSFDQHCISLLPSGPYSNLQDFVNSTSRTPNESLAAQQKCHPGITSHEFLAFSSLRAGERIQWLNIIRELGSADLSFNAAEVHVLIRQAALQAGSRAKHTVLREAHIPFADPNFCARLINLLDGHLSNITSNWREQSRLATIALLGLRTLTLSVDPSTAALAMQLLRGVRKVALRWCRDISSNVEKCKTEAESGRMRVFLCQSALTCRMTYDTDHGRTDLVLADQSDVADFVESAIYLNDNYSAYQQNASTEIRQSVLLDKKLSRRVSSRLRDLISVSGSGINDGIKNAYEVTGLHLNWKLVAGKRGRWMACSRTLQPSGVVQFCHYDVLSGTLLLDGRRVGRLPLEYMSAPLYSRVFDSRILNVTRSQLPCMEYTALKSINGHQVHLAMRHGELLIKAVVGERHLRLIPHEVLKLDLPRCLTDGFIHWMDLRSGEIEFRPLKSPWDIPERTWRLQFEGNGSSYLEIGNKRLVDGDSKLGKAVLNILQALEYRHNIIIHSTSGGIEAEIPRMRLTFTVNDDGRLESKQLRGIVEPDQSIGCLFGLRNKLILRNMDLHPNIPHRSVVIPYGPVSVSRSSDHSRVTIQLGYASKLPFMQYQVDIRLSRLRSQQGALSKLFLAYLHAVTGWVMSDPLSGHTGTQEALRILREQSLRTSASINEEVVPLLNMIAELTPSRFFYPRDLRKMQEVEFQSALGELAQHEDFHSLVEDLVGYASQLDMLETGPSPVLILESRGDPVLLLRAANRNSCLRNTHLGEKERCDTVYVARDGNGDSAEARRVYEVASLVRLWPKKTDVARDLASRVKQWGQIEGYNQKLDLSELTCSDLLEFPVGRKWGSLYELCRGCDRSIDQYKLVRLFAMVVFAQAESLPDVRTLLGIASSGMFTDIQAAKSRYDLTFGVFPDHSLLHSTVSKYMSEPVKAKNESHEEWEGRLAAFRIKMEQDVPSIVNHILGLWPCDVPGVPLSLVRSIARHTEAMTECEGYFTSWNDNRKFMMHIAGVESELRKIWSGPVDIPLRVLPKRSNLTCERASVVLAPDLIGLLSQRTSPKPPIIPLPIQASRPSQPAKHLPGLEELGGIIESMMDDDEPTRTAYAKDLDASLSSLKQANLPKTPETIPLHNDELLDHHAGLKKQVSAALYSTNLTLRPKELSDTVLHHVGLWPRIDTASLLACLSAHRRRSVPGHWQDFLISFGQLLSSLQRLERLLTLRHRNDILGFYKEAEESGHQSWSAAEYPDWLLIEIENDLTIRDIQAKVARKMIQPDEQRNAVLQLNMGEGKSSVIVPMVMTALSNGVTVGRLVVLKPLLRQTLDLLSQRLGGLVDRRIFHAPFTRENRLEASQVTQLRAHFEQCRTDQCVVVTLPEHMMSFRLTGRERLRTEAQLGWQIIDLEKWLSATCRDVLDESDAILDPRFQLVYSMGNQRMMDGQPDRWVLTQRLLALFSRQACRLQDEGSQDVEVDFRGRGFPVITFRKPEVGLILSDRVVEEIGRGSLLGVSLSHCSVAVRKAVLEFIRDRSVSEKTLTVVKQEFWASSSWKNLHLLRGLIANNILLFSFQQKRWLVNYGLDLSRCKMAVPYRAKGVPSISAEFGHPDVAIVLTCLSYYYNGLTSAQLRQAFDNLFRESDPASEYELWAQDCPSLSIRSLHGINLEDERSWADIIFPQLRFSKSAVDYFMTTVVFPHEGKEFPTKLSTSAWDIPSEMQPSTGFSGTNDNKFLLPLSIHQNDLPQLHHTNAMVANMLLQRENRQYLEAKDISGKRLNTERLLELFCTQTPAVTVLIDVGAQVLEANNEDVAKKWLQLSPNADAAVFFDEADVKRVVDRQGFVERLSSSGFHQNLDSCLIYLDEVHTRGVDISMPTHARAAVTLGPKTTKDRLVQACMRMRQLGCHQSLVFFAPPEVHQEIFALSDKQQDAKLNSLDVLRWSFEQTCQATSSIKPLWIMQGLEHSHRKRLCAQYLQGETSTPSNTADFSSRLEEPEGRTLQEMYGGGSGEAVFRACLTDAEARRDPTVQHLLSEWHAFKQGPSRDWSLQEEQEREIAHEVEQERELQLPPPAEPFAHTLDPAVRSFAATGTLTASASPTAAIQPAFATLRSTTAFPHLPPTSGPAQALLYATADFAGTVATAPGSFADAFLRPVKWILSRKPGMASSSDADAPLLLIISPFEADALLPAIRRNSTAVRLHVYSPKTSRAMRDFSRLDYYNVCGEAGAEAYGAEAYRADALVAAQLGVFGGSLFFEEWAAYKVVADWLGIVTDAEGVVEGVVVGRDGFVGEEGRRRMGWRVESPFGESPVGFVNALVGIRRKGHVYSQTHLGHLLGGRVLTEEGFGRV